MIPGQMNNITENSLDKVGWDLGNQFGPEDVNILSSKFSQRPLKTSQMNAKANICLRFKMCFKIFLG